MYYIFILFKNHCQLNLKTTKMALGETGKVDFGRNGCRPKKVFKKQFVSICQTRWVERHDSVLHFKMSLPEVINALTSTKYR